MIDINLFRENPDVIKKSQSDRGKDTEVVDRVIEIDSQWREYKQNEEKMLQEKNTLSTEINELKKNNRDASEQISQVRCISNDIKEYGSKAKDFLGQRNNLLLSIPNLLDESVPYGESEDDNVELKRWGDKPEYDFDPLDHSKLLSILDIADLKRGGKVAGSRFFYMKNEGVILDKAIQALALKYLKEKEFTLMEPPFMVRRKVMEGAVDLSAFEDVLYKIEGEDLYLIATSEHALAGLHMDETIKESDLPLRYAGVSPCFRKEAGAAGKDTKGIFRVHQFNKIEQFIYSMPDESSWDEHNLMIENAEDIFQNLEIPYRIVDLCGVDVGGSASRCYDLEIWMGAQNRFREAVSCSNCTDYQARKLNFKVQKEDGSKEIGYTLNSTAIATGRAIIAILENNQQEDHSVLIPEALHDLTGFKAIYPK